METAELIGRRGGVGSFVLEPRAIPGAVRCQTCGRRHLWHQLEARHIHTPDRPFDDSDAVVALTCPRCGVRGVLAPGVWTDAATDELWTALLRHASCFWCDLLREARDEPA
jgi:hypothetical protein